LFVTNRVEIVRMNGTILRAWSIARRNMPMQLAAVLLLIVTYTSCLLAWSAAKNIRNVYSNWAGDGHLIVFLEIPSSSSEIEAMHHFLESSSLVENFRFVSASQALDQLKDTIGEDTKELLASLEEKLLAESFEIRISTGSDIATKQQFVELLTQQKGVESVTLNENWREKYDAFLALARSLSWASMVFAVGFAAIISVIIGFLCIYINWREISVLRMVGATNRYILAPHRLLVLLQSGIAAIASIVVSDWLYQCIASKVHIALGNGILLSRMPYNRTCVIVSALVFTTVVLAYIALLVILPRVNTLE